MINALNEIKEEEEEAAAKGKASNAWNSSGERENWIQAVCVCDDVNNRLISDIFGWGWAGFFLDEIRVRWCDFSILIFCFHFWKWHQHFSLILVRWFSLW